MRPTLLNQSPLVGPRDLDEPVRAFLLIGDTARFFRSIAEVAIQIAEAAGADQRKLADLRRWLAAANRRM